MHNIYLIGFMGTGKTTVSRMLAERLHYTAVEMDELIEFHAKMSISDIFEKYGEEHFRILEEELLQQFSGKEKHVISTGGGVVLRDRNIATMRRDGQVVLLTAEPETIYYRVHLDKKRPLLQHDMSLVRIKGMLSARKKQYQKAAHFTVSTEQKQVAEIVEEIYTQLLK